MTASPVELGRRAPLRLHRAPSAEPPYDDEVTRAPITDGALVLAFPLHSTIPVRVVPPASSERATEPHVGGLPEPLAWTARLAQAVAEVLAGARPAGQLSRYTTLEMLDRLDRWAGRLQRPGAPTLRPLVRSVHVSRPVVHAVEACAVIDTGPRRRAIALRIEARHGSWQCTSLELG
jgi:hypothetical protein